MAHHPNTELVAVGWVKAVTGYTTAATELPEDNTSWSASGFYQLAAVGGSPDVDVPIAMPVVSVDCWAVAPGSGHPPWGKAYGLAEHVRAAVNLRPFPPRRITFTGSLAGYTPADVIGAVMLTEPRRINDDQADYAHVTFDLALNWVEVS